jgi:hypothetical protein
VGAVGAGSAGPVAAGAAADGGERRCAPGSGGSGKGPAVPARAAGQAEHGIPAAGRAAVTGCGAPCEVPRALVRVRGPDRPAPGPVELSVMRV